MNAMRKKQQKAQALKQMKANRVYMLAINPLQRRWHMFSVVQILLKYMDGECMGTITMETIYFIYGLEVFCITNQGKFLFNINAHIYHTRFYPDSPSANEVKWWFCKNDYSLYPQSEIMRVYNFKTEVDIAESDTFLLFVRVDATALETHYLEQFYPRISKKIAVNDQGKSFRIFIERNNGSAHWHNYEKEELRTIVIKWCKEHNIAYC